MDYQYGYILGNIVLLIIWAILFFWRKDVRKEMIIMSIIFAFAGLSVEYVYITDWWHPQTLTNSKIGFEDILFGFIIGGISSVIYEEVFKKKIKIRKVKKEREIIQNKNFIFALVMSIILFFGSFLFLKFNSFIASVISLTFTTLWILVKRKDFIIDSIASGFLVAVVSFLAYIIPEIFMPGIINGFWYNQNLSGITILKAPIEDIVWFFLTGAFIGPLYEFWKEGKIVNH